MFTQKQLNVISFCAAEVEHQEDKPMMVYNMLHAWNIVARDIQLGKYQNLTIREMLTPGYVRYLAMCVHPYKGFIRKGPVVINNRTVGPHYQGIPRLMEILFSKETLTNLSPTQVYIEFEKIHPFSDGNGRVGLILFNALYGSMENPSKPNVGNVFAWSCS